MTNNYANVYDVGNYEQSNSVNYGGYEDKNNYIR